MTARSLGYTVGALDTVAAPAEYLDAAQPAVVMSGRLALGLVAGLIAVLVPGEFARLSTQELTWAALVGR